ncbi:MAG: DUF6701 domain-containing protein [Betaproteobacteria bacterium]
MIKLIRVISFLLLGSLGFAGAAGAVTVSSGPATCISLGGPNQNWSNTNRAQAQDNSYATASVNDGQITDPLQCTDYGFAIPAAAVINGITVTVWRLASNNSCCTDVQMQLVKAGTIQATDNSTTTFYPTSNTSEAHGNATDLWGTTWTPADINNVNFGAVFATQKTVTAGGGRTISVDYIQITIDYVIPVAAVINTYYPGSASVAAGAGSITLGPATGASTPISAGDMLLIMQMQGAAIDSSNTGTYGTASSLSAGTYEYVIASNAVPLSGGTLTTSCRTLNAYTSAAASTASGQSTFQVIRVPVFASYTLASITALAWNGSTGGVLAFDVTGALNLNSTTISVTGLGFRGGAGRNSTTGSGANTDYRTPVTNLANGSKGEGIAGTPYYVLTSTNTLVTTGIDGYPNGSFARGAPVNGGGGGTDINPTANDQNPGGGGGANAGSGGQGGIGWCPGFNTTAPTYGCGIAGQVSAINPGGSTGGFGGKSVTGLGATRLTMGGGGGAGTTNNATGANGALSTSGVPGGGIIMVRAGSMTGTGTFNANGKDGDITVANDGAGGGGAGGAVMISAASGMSGLTINATGGIGGSTLVPASQVPATTATPHGPGGGGGGGVILTSGAPAGASSAAGGSNGVTYNNGTLFGAYGSTPGSSGSLISALTAASIPGVALGALTCGPDHYEIQSAGSGLTCAANTLTVVACANAACSAAYLSGVSGSLSATGSPTVNWDGSTGGAAGSAFVIASGFGSVTKNVQVATAGTVTFGFATVTPSPINPTKCNFGTNAPTNNNCVFTSNTAGFIFSDTSSPGNAYTIPAQVSGIATPTLYLRAVQASTTNPAICTPAIISQVTSVSMGYACNNPASCQPGNLATINATAIGSGGAPVSLTFDANGSAPITARYDDVGRITLNASETVTPFGSATPVTLTGSSNAYVVAPHHFTFSGVTGAPIKAGTNFSATVTAYNGLVTPTVTANFGQESAPGPESVTLSLTKCQPTGVGSSAGSFIGNVGAFASGVASASNLNWSEVGNGDIVATLTSGSYLLSGLTATGNTGTGGTACSGAGNVGRFIPDHFDTVVSGGISCPAGVSCPCPVGSTCPPTTNNGFVYSGQPFTTNVIARNAFGGTTVNYDGTASMSPNFAKAVTLSAWDATGSTTTQNPPSATPGSLYAPIAATSFSRGTTVLGTPAQSIYTFGTKPTVPTNIYLRAADTDGVTSLRVPANTSIENGITVVSGRIQIANAFGSQVLQLPIRANVQYWSATLGWTNSSTDSVTTLNATTVTSANWSNVTPANWQKLIPASTWAAGSTSVVPATASVAFVNGAGSFTLAIPGSTNTGSVDLSVPAVTGASCQVASVPLGCYLPSNTARATFGVYKSDDNFIYLRENF